MACVQWNESYSLGIKEIDDQHQKLAGIMNKLCDSIDRKSEKEDIAGILDEMADYAESHFSTEEEYFHKFHYVKTAEHEAEHQVFRDKVKALKWDLREGEESVSTDAISFLGEWFIDHTQDEDKKYVQCFHEHGL